MDVYPWEIDFFERPDGKMPLRDLLDSIPKVDREYILNDLTMLARYGPQIGQPLVIDLGDRAWEIRIQTPKNTYRLLCFEADGQLVFTHGFQNRTRLPLGEIRNLKDFRKGYLASRQKPS
jgi:phage-related protein